MQFNDSFKYYKSRKPPPNFDDVIDVRNYSNSNNDQQVRKTTFVQIGNESTELDLGLVSHKNWNIYEFNNIPGLILIENPFSVAGQQQWILKCLKEYTNKPSKLNIDEHGFSSSSRSWWETCFGSQENKELLSKLRWATLGYHHNWNTKHYSEDSKTKVPSDLMNLTSYFARILGFSEFKAEAAIVNFYRMNSTLAGHTDHSEVFLQAPLFSVSFGQAAVFLIGGFEKEDQAQGIFLRSGDVLVMSGTARLRYHGVPRIVKSDDCPWREQKDDEDWKKACDYIAEARINLNVRQVLTPGQTSL